jgi:hypothetical protein
MELKIGSQAAGRSGPGLTLTVYHEISKIGIIVGFVGKYR